MVVRPEETHGQRRRWGRIASLLKSPGSTKGPVPLHHVLEPVQDLPFWSIRGGIHHPDSDQVLLAVSHRHDEHISGHGLGFR